VILTIFDIKPIIQINGEQIRDLTYPSVRYNFSPFATGVVAMNDKMVVRPDLVSRAGYGNDSYWDMILKYNGYSNPFAIDVDDVFLIPSLDDMKEQITPSASQDVIADTVRKQYIDVSKKAKLDPKVAAAELKRREAQKKLAEGAAAPSTNNLPPNIAEEGDREIIVKGGKVYFGPDISRNKQACETPLTKSEFISKLIKNRLKNG
jgi:hypothetical protein